MIDERDLLEVLKTELEFLAKGGYAKSPRESWRPPLIFEDSPTCIHHDCQGSPEECSHCVLMQLVPPELRAATAPCRHIALNAAGETLDSLYRTGDQREIEESLRAWLGDTIAKLEEARRSDPPSEKRNPDRSEATGDGTASQEFRPKCANPGCPTSFEWHGGGRFFRFRPDEDKKNSGKVGPEPQHNLHGVKHYWLCQRCAQVFTLVHDEGLGIVVRMLYPELPYQGPQKALSAGAKN